MACGSYTEPHALALHITYLAWQASLAAQNCNVQTTQTTQRAENLITAPEAGRCIGHLPRRVVSKRSFDDQTQDRVRLETEAVALVLDRIDAGEWRLVASEMCVIEVAAIPDAVRRSRIQLLLPDSPKIRKLRPSTFTRAAELEKRGFKPADALHVAAADDAAVDVLLTCDDRFFRAAIRNSEFLITKVSNPVNWPGGRR
jgi:predicted nucleic acid-binding protein